MPRYRILAAVLLCAALGACAGGGRYGGYGKLPGSGYGGGYTVCVVQPGDTVSEIAWRYGTSTREIVRLNKLRDPHTIYTGQRLRVPVGRTPLLASRTPKPAPSHSGSGGAGAKPRPKPAPHRDDANDIPPPVSTADANFAWPLKGKVISGFGSRDSGARNDGINIAAQPGAPVRAAADGVVTYAGNELKGYGNLILVRHDNGFVTAYAHNADLVVEKGDRVKRGEVIAFAGQTGNVGSPQLHFEIRRGVEPVDPRSYLVASN